MSVQPTASIEGRAAFSRAEGTGATVPLLSRRFFFITGKGGVGKSTVARAFALLLSGRRERVLLSRVGTRSEAPAQTAEHLWESTVGGDAPLDEYLSRMLPGVLHRRVVRSRAYRQFVASAPGLPELMLIGKLADEIRWGAPDAPWDALVVDGPATGHALELLTMPAATRDSFGELVRRESVKIVSMLESPHSSAVCLVATPEELPVQEAAEAAARLQQHRIAQGPLILNRILRAPREARQLAVPADASAPLRELLRCGRETALWSALHEEQLQRARPCVELPFLFCEAFGREQHMRLAEELRRQLEGDR